MPEYDSFAGFYDRLYDFLTDDIPFYTELAKEAKGPVCELACGTGRVLLPLARAGINMTGLELSQPMLDVLQSKLDLEPRELQARVALKCADMREYRFSTQFKLVFCAFNSFLHLMTTDDQLACLRSVREYLAPDGLLCIKLFAPFHDRLAKVNEVEDEARDDGTLVRIFSKRNMAEQTIATTFVVDTTGPDGLVRRQSTSPTLCWIHHREMHLLLRLAGYEVVHAWGGYDKRPYDYVSGSQIFIARSNPA